MPLSKPTANFTFSTKPSCRIWLSLLSTIRVFIAGALSSELCNLDAVRGYVSGTVFVSTLLPPPQCPGQRHIPVTHLLNKCLSIIHVCLVSYSIMRIKSGKRHSSCLTEIGKQRNNSLESSVLCFLLQSMNTRLKAKATQWRGTQV